MANTTADKLNLLMQTKEDLYLALTEQGQTVDAVFSAYPAAVRAIPRVREDAPYNDVSFYDTDGTRLFSYSLEEARALTELPVPPSRPGLVFQQWNWTLEEVQALEAPAGIGANYITDDGKTRLHLNIPASAAGGLGSAIHSDCSLYFQQSAANGVIIDWGDGSASETVDGTGAVSAGHMFEEAGQYTVTLEPVGDCVLGLGHNSSSCSLLGMYGTTTEDRRSVLTAVEIGRNVPELSSYALHSCFNLTTFTMPAEMTAVQTGAFFNCASLLQLTIPRGMTVLPNGAFNNLESLIHLSLPCTVEEIANSAFKSITVCREPLALPPAVHTIGDSNFTYSGFLSVRIPAGVQTIGQQAFYSCQSLREVYLLSTTPPALGGANTFDALDSSCVFYVPAGSLADYQAATYWSDVAANYSMVEF